MAEAVRDGLRLEAIAADIATDGETALYMLDINAYDMVVLDRDLPHLSGDEVAARIVQSGSGLPYGSGHAPLSRRLGLLASLRSRHRDRHHLDLCSQSLGPAEGLPPADPHRSHRTSGRRSPGRVVARRQDVVTACTNHRGDTRRRYRVSSLTGSTWMTGWRVWSTGGCLRWDACEARVARLREARCVPDN